MVKPATIYDVARAAGVSHQTVSRLLGGFEGIRPETRARVEAAVVELGYRPNSAARSLRQGRRNRIVLLADRIDQTGPARVVAGATHLAQTLGYLVDVVSIDALEDVAADSALAILRDSQVAGVLATAQTATEKALLARLVGDGPTVIDEQGVTTVEGYPLNELAGRIAAEHLVALGHRRLAYLAGPPAWIAAAGRLKGFRERAAELGAEVLRVEHGDWSAASGQRAWRAMDPLGAAATAVACGNDSMAIGLIAAAFDDGVLVPRDLSVLGTDDIPEAAFLRPALSTVTLDFEGEGAHYVLALLRELGQDPALPEPLSSPRITPRGSTAAR